MKKFCVIIMSVLLLFGLTQCKKKSTEPSKPKTKTVTLSVVAEIGSFSKVNVNPSAGASSVAVEFEDGDVLYVGNGGRYVGKLKYNNGFFAGAITKNLLSSDDYLHFYFLGNKSTEESLTAGSSTECSVKIIDQSVKYPVISYGRSTEMYKSGEKNYNTVLENKCAMVMFRTTSINTSNIVTVTGMNNLVDVDFTANMGETVGEPFTYSVDDATNGAIKLHAESDVIRWAVLLPQGEVTNAKASAFAYVTETDFTVPAISANAFYDTGVEINLVPGGAIDGTFSVSKTKKVNFSRGNLIANCEGSWDTWVWSFAQHQYDKVETANVSSDYQSETAVGLLGWATSGKNLRGTETNYYYKPFNTNSNGSSYGPNGLYSLIASNREGDWGVYNSTEIVNGGGYTTWRTLMKEEWEYLVNFSNNSNYRKVTVNGSKKVPYGKAVVMGVKGFILLPDNWNGNMHPNFVYGKSAWANVYNSTTTPSWAEMETAGVVFMPAAGYREGTTVGQINEQGAYWTANSGTDQSSACMFFFDQSEEGVNNVPRNIGMSVRLVRNAE